MSFEEKCEIFQLPNAICEIVHQKYEMCDQEYEMPITNTRCHASKCEIHLQIYVFFTPTCCEYDKEERT